MTHVENDATSAAEYGSVEERIRAFRESEQRAREHHEERARSADIRAQRDTEVYRILYSIREEL